MSQTFSQNDRPLCQCEHCSQVRPYEKLHFLIMILSLIFILKNI
jgi:hypothetical protein